MSTMTDRELLRRMSACWKACRGIETAVLEGHSLGVIAATHSQRLHDAEKQRDSLLAALELIADSEQPPRSAGA